MKPLSPEALQAIVAAKTATIRFPTHDTAVTVRQLTAAETSRVHGVILGRKETDGLNREVDILVASIGITDADYDTDAGREALAGLPQPMIRKIVDAITGLSGADGETTKN